MFWVHSDHSHWLLRIHDNAVSMATKTSHALSLQGSLDKESVDVHVQFGEGGVQLSLEGEREEEEELGGKVPLAGHRGRPVQVNTESLMRYVYMLTLLPSPSLSLLSRLMFTSLAKRASA